MGFTPRRRAWKACPSQNDDFLPRFGIYPLYTALQGTSIPKRFGTRASGNDTTLPIVAHSTQALSQRTPAATQGTLAVGTRHLSSCNKALRHLAHSSLQLQQGFPQSPHGTPAVSTTIFGHAHRGKSTKHTTQIACLAVSATKMAKNHTRNCYYRRN